MGSEFTKQLIALLSSCGGIITLSLAELEQLGIEVTLQSLASPAASLTLRLGAKIYYVPQETPAWPSTPASSPEEVEAVNQLNNQPRKRAMPRLQEPQPQPPLIEGVEPHTPLRKTDLDLFLAEQRLSNTRARHAADKARQEKNAGRQLPWETRKQ